METVPDQRPPSEIAASPAFMDQGAFTLGVNYWASHAGTAMWSEWREDVVADDLRQLADAGLQVLRVFPLWPDFQPLTLLRAGHGEVREYRLGEERLPDTAAGQAGLDEGMLLRFGRFCEMAEEHGLRLVVGLVTGWMSGRLFVPPAFAQSDPLTEPTVIKWQVRFVRHFVDRFRNESAILAWDLGNECNCMGRATPDQAWTWTHAIASAIRNADPTRLVVSGMHSLRFEEVSGLIGSNAAQGDRYSWPVAQQAELTDVLTTHPYPPFTEHCDQDPIDTLRTNLHATAETRLYADIGGKPCFAEEAGSLGTWFGGEERAANFLRANLFSLWANDCRGLFWWNNHDFSRLTHPPYDWNMVEQELGLFDADRRPRRLVGEFRSFAQFLGETAAHPLPPRRVEAVCLLSLDQDGWGAALSAFILAKQAGFDLRFQTTDQPLRDADLYLLPSLSGMRPFSVRFFNELVSRVDAGATLYTSLDDAALSRLPELAGVEVESRERTGGPTVYGGLFGGEEIALVSNGPFRLNLFTGDAQVLARDPEGRAVFTKAQVGRGTSYLLTRPLEIDLARTPRAHLEGPLAEAWRVYAKIAREIVENSRVARKSSPLMTCTEHPESDDARLVVLLNHGLTDVEEIVTLAPGWQVGDVLRGSIRGSSGELKVELPHHDAAIVRVRKS